MKYYASYEKVLTEVAIFDTAEERDEWVNYQDWHSIATVTTAENSALKRIALSDEEAKDIAGDLLDFPECFDPDALLDNVKWVTII